MGRPIPKQHNIMKTLAITLALLTSMFAAQASTFSVSKEKDKNKKKTEQVRTSIEKQISKHIYFPQTEKEALEGTADVTLQVYPDGDVRVILIQSKNPLVKKFIERQVNKMKVDQNSVVVGELFKYRFEFKRQN